MIQNLWPCRYELLDDLAPASRGGAADVAKETLEVVMETISQILPMEAARLAPPLSKVTHVAVMISMQYHHMTITIDFVWNFSSNSLGCLRRWCRHYWCGCSNRHTADLA